MSAKSTSSDDIGGGGTEGGGGERGRGRTEGGGGGGGRRLLSLTTTVAEAWKGPSHSRCLRASDERVGCRGLRCSATSAGPPREAAEGEEEKEGEREEASPSAGQR